ncbi:MADS-box transcription factor [Trema orientale]|uniref:MADS-box transcription factor n=1 Tax=Trema orientale TaxID=63057 RepID=A0A2P5FC81_TREOI|nr:MADS-box transcription factor [Trema orientale]
MGRGKLPLKLMPKEQARKRTFQKRKIGLIKKAYELSTLCDVKVCLVINDVNNNNNNQSGDQVVAPSSSSSSSIITWPKERREVAAIIDAYEAAMANNPPSKRLQTLSDFFAERTKKVMAETQKLHDQTNHNEIAELSENQVFELHSHLNHRIQQVEEQIMRRRSTTYYYNNNNNQFAIQDIPRMNMQPSLDYYSSSHHHEAVATPQMYGHFPYYANTPQPWNIDQPSSSNNPFPVASQTTSLDLNHHPYKGSFNMLLNSHDYAGNSSTSTNTYDDHARHNGSIQCYSGSSGAPLEGAAGDHFAMRYGDVFNGPPLLESGMMQQSDQNGMMLISNNNPMSLALQQPSTYHVNQPLLPLLAGTSDPEWLYCPTIEPVSRQSRPAEAMPSSSSHGGQMYPSSQGDVNYYYPQQQ